MEVISPKLDDSSSIPLSTRNNIHKYVEQYEQWVCKHTSIARNLETALYIAPQLVPASLKDPELSSECGYAAVGLLKLYHDYILYKTAKKPITPLCMGDQLARLIRVPLTLVSHIQVLVEGTARKYGGEKSRWRVIVWIELLKLMAKVLLLLQERRHMLVDGGKYKSVHPEGAPSAFTKFSTRVKGNTNLSAGPRSGKIFGAKGNNDTTVTVPDTNSQAITFNEATISVDMVVREPLLVGGELIHIARPAIYAMLRARRGEKSWLPVVVSLVLELTGLVATTSAFQEEGIAFSRYGKEPLGKKVQSAMSDRKMALLLYILKDPVFESVTKPITNKICDTTDTVPILGKILRMLSTSVLKYYHQFHFYSSGS